MINDKEIKKGEKPQNFYYIILFLHRFERTSDCATLVERERYKKEREMARLIPMIKAFSLTYYQITSHKKFYSFAKSNFCSK